MPTFDSVIHDVVVGDDVTIRRTIDVAASGFSSGTTVVEAWMTMKAHVSDPDPGIFQKTISIADQPGVGQIENDGTGDVDVVLRFDLVPADTIAVGLAKRHWDIQIKTAAGKVHTPEKGTMRGVQGITLSS